MKSGDSILGYRLTTDGSTAGGGRSMWAFAERGDESFFVKRFLTPKYPVDGAPGSDKNRQRALHRCQEFERSNEAIRSVLAKKVGRGGSLVYPISFGRDGTTYYKVYEKVDVSGLSTKDISALAGADRALILRVVAHSVSLLHREGIVHGDLKPDNILIKRSVTGAPTAKLIDFDDAYFEHQAPKDPELLVGDQVYFSPEVLRFNQSADPSLAQHIDTKSDIFAMGLIFFAYISGSLPRFDTGKFGTAAAFVLSGGTFDEKTLGTADGLASLLMRMLSREPEDRPSAEEVLAQLKSAGFHPRTGSISPPTPIPASKEPRLLLRRREAPSETLREVSPPAIPSADPSTGRLFIKDRSSPKR